MTYALIGLIVVLVVVAGIGWGLYATKVPAPSISEKESQVTALAYEHWQAIGIEGAGTLVAYNPHPMPATTTRTTIRPISA